MNEPVQNAVEELQLAFPEHRVECEPDCDGGAYVRVHDLYVGEQYQPNRSWFAFRITFQYPHADVYPHFCSPDLTRRDGGALGQGFGNGHWQQGKRKVPATQVSRRSNKLNPATDTAALKLAKVVDWVRSR